MQGPGWIVGNPSIETVERRDLVAQPSIAECPSSNHNRRREATLPFKPAARATLFGGLLFNPSARLPSQLFGAFICEIQT
jgi:hypothetical protein